MSNGRSVRKLQVPRSNTSFSLVSSVEDLAKMLKITGSIAAWQFSKRSEHTPPGELHPVEGQNSAITRLL